jgi:LysM repeat protein
MKQRVAGIALTFAVIVLVVVVSGCNRPMSSGPLPPPQTTGTVLATVEPMSQVTPQAQAAAGTTPQAAATTTAPEAAATEAAPAPTAQPEPTATPAAAAAQTTSGPTTYTVKPGDGLYGIARQFGVNWYAIAQANNLYPPYRIYPGQQLTIPGATTPPQPNPSPSQYVVQPGDTIFSIGRKLGKSPIAIINANTLINPNHILPGQVLQIP